VLRQIQQLVEQGNFAEAARQLAEARQRYPKDGAFCDLLNVVQAERGGYGSAESSFLKATADTSSGMRTPASVRAFTAPMAVRSLLQRIATRQYAHVHAAPGYRLDPGYFKERGPCRVTARDIV
jgi:hypothetical protein